MFSSIHSFAPLLPEFLAGVGFLAGVRILEIPSEIFYFTTLAEDLE
jgi:hypothetical protein